MEISMKKQKKLILGLFFMVPIIMCAAIYVALGLYYQGGFSYGTWVNGVYCTGKSVTAINEELLKNETADTFTIYGKEEAEENISLAEIDYHITYEPPLQEMQKTQNPFLWGLQLFQGKEKILLPQLSYNQEALEEKLNQLSMIKEGSLLTNPDVRLIKTEKGYELQDQTKQVLQVNKAKEVIKSALQEGKKSVSLQEALCYEDTELTPKMLAVYDLWKKVNAFQDCKITYQFGDAQEKIDSSIVADWIALDENGGFLFDENGELQLEDGKIEEYIAHLGDKYDTYKKTRKFMATRGEEVLIEGGTYGNQLNQKAEMAYLKDAFYQKKEEVHIPEYSKTAKTQGENDLGDTYIEIDMQTQTMYYYKSGAIVLETPIVTGNISRKWSTPARTCYVYGKQRNRVLKGPGYASPVNFWMPVNGNIGIHDAKWRKTFGGEIYKTNGSHGCINTPYDKMKELYEMVEVGTPVLMFY